MTKKTLIEYLITIGITLLIALVTVGVVTLTLKNSAKRNCLKMPKAQSVREDRRAVVKLIAKFEKESMQNPADYTFNTKLGNLYDILGDDKEAQKNFQNAVAKSPYGIYSTYFDLASFYIKTGRFSDAEKTVKEIKNKNNKVLQLAKGDFYVNLGDAYFDFQEYENAFVQYETALRYYKDSNKKDRAEIIRSRLLDTYDGLADKNIEQKKLHTAISYLEESLKYDEDSPFIHYKLAILYKDIDPLKAYSYMRKTYDSDPGIINFDIYEKIILDIINKFKADGNVDEQTFFTHKLKLLKKFKERYFIKDGDYRVEIKSYKIKNHFFGNGKTLYVKFKLKNLSQTNANTIFLTVDANYNNKNTVIMHKRMFSKKVPLSPMTDSELITLKYSFDDSINADYTTNLKLNFRVTKKKNLRSTLIDTLNITK